MSRSNETNHVLIVKARTDDIGCERADCGLWASGMLRYQRERHSKLAILIMTAAGCSECGQPSVRNSDLGVKGSVEIPDVSDPVDVLASLVEAGTHKLAEEAQGILDSPSSAGR